MKVFVAASGAMVALAATQTNAAFPAEVTALMDATADPCDDFYQYTCGGWAQNYTLRADEESFTYAFGTIEDRNKQLLQDVLKEDWPLVGELYESCMALDALSARGNQPLQVGLARIQQVTSKKHLVKLASSIGPPLFSGIGVFPDLHDASTNVLYVGSMELLLPDKKYYTDPEYFMTVEAPFRQYISTLVQLAGIKLSLDDSTHAEDVVIRIEKQFAAIQPTDEETDGYYATTYRDAAAKYSLTFRAMAKGLGLLKKSALTEDSKVLLASPAFMERAEKLLHLLDLEDLKLYYAVLYAHFNVPYLGDAFGQARFEFFFQELQGIQERSPREETCSYRVIELLPDLIGKYYFLKTFESDREQNVEAMVSAIEQAMVEHIARLTWLDEATREQAAAKLAKVANLVGHSTNKKSYPFVLSRDNFFANAHAILAQGLKEDIARIGMRVDRSAWEISPATVNAYYEPTENKMVFPAAILQPPFYNGGSHPVQNFGAIGAVIGHELTHGFDTMGSDFDGDGNKRNWWSEASKEAFEARAACMEAQYSEMVALGDSAEPVGNVNGTLTIGENIADNGGVSLAFDAYHNWVKRSALEFDAKGVNDREVDQLFFVSFGQVWCSKIRDASLAQQLMGEPHAPDPARVNGVAMNSEPFARAFQCKPGSKMNPANKCKLW